MSLEPPEDERMKSVELFTEEEIEELEASLLLEACFQQVTPESDVDMYYEDDYYEEFEEIPVYVNVNEKNSFYFSYDTEYSDRWWDSEAHYYDLQGNLIYQPPDPLASKLDKVHLSSASNLRKPDRISPSSPTKHTALKKSIPCRYYPHCHAGVNCLYQHM